VIATTVGVAITALGSPATSCGINGPSANEVAASTVDASGVSCDVDDEPQAAHESNKHMDARIVGIYRHSRARPRSEFDPRAVST